MIAFAAELVVLILFLLWNNRSYRELVLLGLICGGLVIWLLWLRPVGLFERLARLLNPIANAGPTGRLAIVKDRIKMVAQRPFFGWGQETFSTVYPSFRGFSQNWISESHNDFVQILVESDSPGISAGVKIDDIAPRWRRDVAE